MPPTPKLPVVYVGVDPGVSGGLAVLLEDATVLDTVPVGNHTLYQLWDWFRYYGDAATCRAWACLELVGGYVGGEETARGSRMFSFGASFGRLQGMLVASGIPFVEVRPQEWQKGVGCPARPKGLRNDQWKGVLWDYAKSLFPKSKFTKATADAVLIAEYLRRRHASDE